MLARTTGGSFLIPNTTAIAAILTNIETNVVPLIAQAAVGPVTLSFPHYAVIDLVGAIAEGADGSGGVFQSVPGLAITVDTPPAPPATGGSGSLSGPNIPTVPQLSVTQTKVTVNLTAWFNSPPTDLKLFAPTFTLTSRGGIDSTGTVYPDPTFGGLNGLARGFVIESQQNATARGCNPTLEQTPHPHCAFVSDIRAVPINAIWECGPQRLFDRKCRRLLFVLAGLVEAKWRDPVDSGYVVRDYNVEDIRDAERLGKMFVTFDSVWPGGFMNGEEPSLNTYLN